jgi:hypothetical protein
VRGCLLLFLSLFPLLQCFGSSGLLSVLWFAAFAVLFIAGMEKDD